MRLNARHTLRSLRTIGLADIWLLIADDETTRPGDLAIEMQGKRLARRVGLSLRVSREGPRRGTAGAVALALARCRAETVVIVPVDTVFPYHRLRECIAGHCADRNGLTWLVTSKWGELAQNAGKILLDASRRRVIAALEGSMIERNVATQALVAATSGGVMLGERRFLVSHLTAFTTERTSPGPSDLYRDFAPWLLRRGVVVHAVDLMEPVIDLGTPTRTPGSPRGDSPPRVSSSGANQASLVLRPRSSPRAS